MSTSKKILESIALPEGVHAEVEGYLIKLKGPKGNVERKLYHPSVKISATSNSITIEPVAKKYTKNVKRMLRTLKAHLKNMVIGVSEGYTYNLKIVSGHFPMNVALDGNRIVVKNFLGEKVPRVANVLINVKATIKGDEIKIESIDKEAAGQSAANLETATRITKRDRRIFQDGIYITEKPKRLYK